MKVLQLVNDVGTPGGVSVYAVMLDQTLKALGHATVTAATHRATITPLPEKTLEAPLMYGFAKEEDGNWDLRSLTRSLPWVPDLVLSHQPPFPRVSEDLKTLAPLVIFQHTFLCHSGHLFRDHDVVCHRQVGHGCLPRWYGRRCGTHKDPRVAWQMVRQAERDRISLLLASKVVVNSQYLGNQLQREGIPLDRIKIVHPGCALLGSHHHGQSQRSAYPLVSFAGRVVYGKGLATLADVISDLAVTLEVAGSGWALSRLPMDQHPTMRLLGFLPHSEIGALHQRAWVSVVPSLAPETFGMTGVEALAMGTPVVAFDAGAISEWLAPHVGTLVDPHPEGRKKALRSALSEYLNSPPSPELEAACRSQAERLCGSTVFARKLRELIEEVEGRRGPDLDRE